mmetsp:Transcript_77466/g.199427  ORF Transcript_77466/g.199427 Transcript_77466/m.199427 type:complete len:465 (-) Transcript_77466:1186-2580(-)
MISPTSNFRTLFPWLAERKVKSEVIVTSFTTLRKSATATPKARRWRPCGAIRERASRTCSSVSAWLRPMPARLARRSESCVSETSVFPPASVPKNSLMSTPSPYSASRSASFTASAACSALVSSVPQTALVSALPLRCSALQRSCSLASSTFAWMSPALAAWLSATMLAAWWMSAVASCTPALAACRRGIGRSAGAFARAATEPTFVSAAFTASLAWRTRLPATDLVRALASSFTLSSLACDFCSLPKMPRSSFSSTPWVFCSFISTCPMVEDSLPWMSWMLCVSSSGGFASSFHSWEAAVSFSTYSSALRRLATSSVSDFSTLIFSSKLLAIFRNLASSPSMYCMRILVFMISPLLFSTSGCSASSGLRSCCFACSSRRARATALWASSSLARACSSDSCSASGAARCSLPPASFILRTTASASSTLPLTASTRLARRRLAASAWKARTRPTPDSICSRTFSS